MLGEAIFGAETVDSGTTAMVLSSISEVSGKYQSAAIRWQFDSADGKQVRKLTGCEFAADLAAGQFLAQLVGRPLGRGDRVILDDLIGRSFEVTVSNGQIVRVKPLAKA